MVDRAGFGPATSRSFGFLLANRAFFGPATKAWYTRLNYLPTQPYTNNRERLTLRLHLRTENVHS